MATVGVKRLRDLLTDLQPVAETGPSGRRRLPLGLFERPVGWFRSVTETQSSFCRLFHHKQSSHHCTLSSTLSPCRSAPPGRPHTADTPTQQAARPARRRYHFRFRWPGKAWAPARRRSRADWCSSAGRAPPVACRSQPGTDRKCSPDTHRKCSRLPVSAAAWWWSRKRSSAPRLYSDVSDSMSKHNNITLTTVRRETSVVRMLGKRVIREHTWKITV